MRNQNKINQLSRTSAHRKAMMSNMAASLIEHKRITTTLAKAKALRGYVEPLITKSKNDTTHSRRLVFRKLQSKEAVSELFREVAPKVASRAGGYTRIIKIGFRQGDSAEMCIIELVDFNDTYTTTTKDKSKKTRRSRRGGGSSKSQGETSSKSDNVAAKTESTAAAETQPEVVDTEVSEKVEESKTEVEASAETSETTESSSEKDETTSDEGSEEEKKSE